MRVLPPALLAHARQRALAPVLGRRLRLGRRDRRLVPFSV